jgi:hypothetical protein
VEVKDDGVYIGGNKESYSNKLGGSFKEEYFTQKE